MLGRLALVLLLALAPALNLAAPIAPRASVQPSNTMQDMARADAAPSEPCTHANVVTSRDGAGCGAGDHADTGHHADPLCLQCVAFGSPGLPGAPDIGTIVPILVAAATYACIPNSQPTSCSDAAYLSRGPPYAV